MINLKKTLKSFLNIFIIFIILILAVFLLTSPKNSAAGVIKGLDISAYHLIPALFPFMVVSSFILESGLFENIGKFLLFDRIFGVNKSASCIIFLSLICGFPAPAKFIGELYEKNLCNKKACEYMLGFCNNASPVFVISIIGISVFKNIYTGILIYCLHILSSLICALIFKKIYRVRSTNEKENTQIEKSNVLSVLMKSISSSASAMISVCAFVTFFAAVTNMLEYIGIEMFFIHKLKLPVENSVNILIKGFFEITGGVLSSPGNFSPINTALLVTILNFSGLSVLCQVTYFADRYNLSIKKYCIMKSVSAIIGFVLTYVTVSIICLF